MTEVAVSVSNSDAATVVAAWGIHLESSELLPLAAVTLLRLRCMTVSGAALAVGRFADAGQEGCSLGQSDRGARVLLQADHHTARRRGEHFHPVALVGVIGMTVSRIVTAHEGQSQPTGDVVDDTLGDANVLVGRVAHRFEPSVAELVDQDFQRHAVLQGDRKCGAETVHDPADGRSFLGHRDEDFAGSTIGIETDAEITFVTGNGELVGHALAGIGQPFATRLVDDLLDRFGDDLRAAGLSNRDPRSWC